MNTMHKRHDFIDLDLNDNELLPSVQSAYQQFFSTAALKEVPDIILAALDRGQIIIIINFYSPVSNTRCHSRHCWVCLISVLLLTLQINPV